MTGAKKHIIGNWKMHGEPHMASALASEIAAFCQDESVIELFLPQNLQKTHVKVVLCPPVILLAEVKASLAGTHIALGAQDCHTHAQGAYTGDISAPMLAGSGCSYVIVGHSERRAQHLESNSLISAKASAAIGAGLIPIICVGETLAEREAGKAEEVVGRQVSESVPQGVKPGQFLLAYEPVWAIGSGKTASADDIARMHTYILSIMPGADVLYGGSVKADNAQEIMNISGVSGVLVGGASLKADEFCAIIGAAQ